VSVAAPPLLAALLLAGCAPEPYEPAAPVDEGSLRVAPNVGERLARLVPTRLEADVSALPESEKQALGHLLAAARLMG
jgi:hypothetical protein